MQSSHGPLVALSSLSFLRSWVQVLHLLLLFVISADIRESLVLFVAAACFASVLLRSIVPSSSSPSLLVCSLSSLQVLRSLPHLRSVPADAQDQGLSGRPGGQLFTESLGALR